MRFFSSFKPYLIEIGIAALIAPAVITIMLTAGIIYLTIKLAEIIKLKKA